MKVIILVIFCLIWSPHRPVESSLINIGLLFRSDGHYQENFQKKFLKIEEERQKIRNLSNQMKCLISDWKSIYWCPIKAQDFGAFKDFTAYSRTRL